MNYSEIIVMTRDNETNQKNKMNIEKMLPMLPDNSNNEFLLHDCETQILYKCTPDSKTLYAREINFAFCSEHPTFITYSVSYEKDKYVKIVNPDPKIKQEEEKVQKAHSASFGNGEAVISEKQKCGCFNCLSIFDSTILTEDNFWKESGGEKTVTCPHCCMDTVLHEKSDFPITINFLKKMKNRFC